MEDEIDWIAVDRKAHELSERHGRPAHQYAARLASEALADGDEDEHRFWQAVEGTLKPR